MATKNPAPTNAGDKRQRIGTTALLAVVNGALVGVATVYATTHSVIVVLIAATAAVLLAGIALFRH